jgi:glycosyltransferase involved in cell wall biosynthesis
MACGTPVVAANAGALPEVVGPAALLVAPADVHGLADALARALLDTHLRTRLSAQGIERAQAFSWDRCARETLAVYRRLAER